MSKRKRPGEEPTNGHSLNRSNSSAFSTPQLIHHQSDASHPRLSVDHRSLSIGNVQTANGVAPLTHSQPVDAAAVSYGLTREATIQGDAPRKFTACEGCRKQKIKCDMLNDEPPCTRCQRRSLPCVLNKNMHALLEDSKRADESLRADVANLYSTLDTVCRHLNLQAPKPLQSGRGDSTAPLESGSGGPSRDEPDCEVSPPGSPSAVQAPIDTFLEVAKLTSPASGDASFISRKHSQQDLISKGILTTQVAERLLDRYLSRLDHYLYGIASMYKDLKDVRHASPTLFAAICTVSALHEPGLDQSVFEACNRELRRLVARSIFDKRDIEYVRGLCIASFWLSDAARIFSSDAIRRAGDMRLHRFFRRAVYPPPENDQGTTVEPSATNHLYPNLSNAQVADRVRLWYLLFICDSHMSILHNRDSLLRSDREITTDWEAFLDRADRADNDVRIASQTSLLLIMGQVRDTLGTQADERLPTATTGQINMFSRQLDKWFTRFSAIFNPNPNIGDFPAKGLRLHYHFGKLNLGHHVFQGLHGSPIPDVFVSAALMAHDAAIAIFQMLLTDEPLQESVIGMPHYFLIMIAFAGHFLLEVCSKYAAQLSLNVADDLGLINRVLMLFENMQCNPQHPVRRMTPGLGQKLFESAAKLDVRLEFNNGGAVAANLNNGNDGSSNVHMSAAAGSSNFSPTNTAEYAIQYYHHQQQQQQQSDYSSTQASLAAGQGWQFPGRQSGGGMMDEMGFSTQFGEFEFPNMSVNFMA